MKTERVLRGEQIHVVKKFIITYIISLDEVSSIKWSYILINFLLPMNARSLLIYSFVIFLCVDYTILY